MPYNPSKNMLTRDKLYLTLCVLFTTLMLLGNLTYQKFVALPLLPFYTFQLSVGVILYPLTFLITDLMVEFYGKEKARFCVRLALLMNTMIALIVTGMDHLPAVPWSQIDNVTFHRVFGVYGIVFMGSIIACYLSQTLDIFLYAWLKKLTQHRHLWVRNAGSTAVSLFLDTVVLISFITAFGLFPKEHMWSLIMDSYAWKLFFTICGVPVFYGCVSLIRFIISHEDAMFAPSPSPHKML